MRWVMRAGWAVMAVGGMAGVARGWCPEGRQGGALEVVPAGGGVFLAQEVESLECRMMMVGGGRWVPLEREPRWGSGVVRYRPVRRLVPGVVYEVVGVDEDGARVRYLRAVAGKAEDRVAPRWRGAPRVAWTQYRPGCLMDEAVVELALEVEDESTLRVMIEARALDGGDGDGDGDGDGAMRAVVRLEGGRALVEWPARGEWFLRPGVPYAARVCAEDAAGNRSCARRPAVFTAPEWRPAEEWWLATAFLLARALWPEVPAVEPVVVAAPPPPEERMERVGALRARVDWRCASAGAAGALLVLAVAALVVARRGARRRVSRVA